MSDTSDTKTYRMRAILAVDLNSCLGICLGTFAKKGQFVNVRTVSFTSEPSENYFEIELNDGWHLVHKSALIFIS